MPGIRSHVLTQILSSLGPTMCPQDNNQGTNWIRTSLLCDGITYTPMCTHLAHATCSMHLLRPTSLTYPSGPEPHRAWYPPSRQLSSQMNVPANSQKHACSAVPGRSETEGAEVEGSGLYSLPCLPSVGSVSGPLTSSRSHVSNSKLISLSTGGLETSAPF